MLATTVSEQCSRTRLKKSSHVTCPMKGMDRWVCGSMPPGITSLPAALSVRVPCRSACGRQSRQGEWEQAGVAAGM